MGPGLADSAARLKIKALIPAAGLGTRWHPWSRVVPKELIPIGSRPALHFVLDEAYAAGIGEIGIVTRSGKELLQAYVDEVWRPERPDVKISWIYQERPLGVGDAVFGAKDWAGGEAVAVLYPDEVHPLSGGLSMLVAAFAAQPALWLGLAPGCAGRRQARYAIEPADGYRCRIAGRSPRDSADLGYGTGRYILPAGWAGMSVYGTKDGAGEFDDDQLIDGYGVDNAWALRLPGPIHDVGCPENWRKAIIQSTEQLYALPNFPLWDTSFDRGNTDRDEAASVVMRSNKEE